ncbi:hypothetical protein V2J09_002819 [Rumex salicifolius]
MFPLPQACNFVAFAYRRITAAVAALPVWASFLISIIVSLIPVIVFFSIPLFFAILRFLSIPVLFSNSFPVPPTNAPLAEPQIHIGHGIPNLPVPEVNFTKLSELAEFDAEEDSPAEEILNLLEETLDENVRSTKHHVANLRRARPLIAYWSDRRFQTDLPPPDKILSNLLGFIGRRKKYSSCAVVGNSGILLDADYGAEIDSHEVVIRLKNAAIGDVSRHVGTKTTISFINSNILHRCARRRPDCFCHPYGNNITVVLYICQPVHLIDVATCNSTGAAGSGKIFVTDPEFDRLCAKIAKYYSLKLWFTGGWNRSLSDWNAAHQGKLFHYSSGMQAVVLAVGVCEKVNLFGFGKSSTSKHNYHTNQTAELKIHDYEAEYEFYRDLMESPEKIPFLSFAVGKFEFPSVTIHLWTLSLRRKKEMWKIWGFSV